MEARICFFVMNIIARFDYCYESLAYFVKNKCRIYRMKKGKTSMRNTTQWLTRIQWIKYKMLLILYTTLLFEISIRKYK